MSPTSFITSTATFTCTSPALYILYIYIIYLYHICTNHHYCCLIKKKMSSLQDSDSGWGGELTDKNSSRLEVYTSPDQHPHLSVHSLADR